MCQRKMNWTLDTAGPSLRSAITALYGAAYGMIVASSFHDWGFMLRKTSSLCICVARVYGFYRFWKNCFMRVHNRSGFCLVWTVDPFWFSTCFFSRHCWRLHQFWAHGSSYVYRRLLHRSRFGGSSTASCQWTSVLAFFSMRYSMPMMRLAAALCYFNWGIWVHVMQLIRSRRLTEFSFSSLL